MEKICFRGITIKGWDCIPDYSSRNKIYSPDYYTLQFNQWGHLIYTSGDNAPASAIGPCAWITHPLTHYIHESPEGMKRYHRYVSFGGPGCEDFIKAGLIPSREPSPLFRITRPNEFIAAFDALQNSLNPSAGPLHTRRHEKGELIEPKSLFNPAVSVQLLEVVLLLMNNQPDEKPISPRKKSIMNLMEAIKRDPGKKRDFKADAEELGLSLSHFRRKFNEISGSSPEKFLRHRRMEKAAELLLGTSERVSDIADLTGYGDVYYFSRLFKQHYHVSPAAYRKETQQLS